MILNAYAVLVLLINAIRLPAALLVVVLASTSIVRFRRSNTPEERKWIENQSYLLVLLGILLLGLNLLSWPLFYLLLQSYVPQWQGVMCIYGVTQIGTGSRGVTAYLPTILATVQVLKPVLVFVCGGWFVLYWINRQTQTAAIMGRVLVAMLLLGMVSLADSALETSYVTIPKRENLPEVGCCTAASTALHNRFVPTSWLGAANAGWLTVAYYVANPLLVMLVLSKLFWFRRSSILGWLLLLVTTTIASGISYLFLIEVAAPTILHLPLHHCAYDLIGSAPESVLGILLFALGVCGVGWAIVANYWGRADSILEATDGVVSRSLFIAGFGFASSLVLMTVELVMNLNV